MSKKKEETGWGEVFDSLKRNVFGFDKDLDDEDFEEVEKLEAPKPKKPVQGSEQEQKLASQAQNRAQTSSEESGSGKAESEALATYSSSLQAGQDLDRFFHTGVASDRLLQLLEEGFAKNPDLLASTTNNLADRGAEELVHPGYLVSYEEMDSMFVTQEKVLNFILTRPGAIVKESIFVSKVKDGNTISTREATEEEKKLFNEQKSSKDNSDQAQ
mgnify:CR=1 FL=1